MTEDEIRLLEGLPVQLGDDQLRLVLFAGRQRSRKLGSIAVLAALRLVEQEPN